ncbi:TetR/AcrR family transcriptional regulator [Cellulomonas persica]|uniref:TetR family transcriptional regulator n=1 Tax=Cellulomonas persica TaxID=76861 RepID=A0A510UQE0_9CELL|nr:TetR/AcrR family transcriptional regulator [Cellulomonas persica]GEK16882.1 TetR family transcriptional regulator [Cellulomonas persica]
MTAQESDRVDAPRGYARGRATREDILRAALVLFGEVGYHTASLREIAARVGISHPGLLHHFPSKAALLEAVLQRRDDVDDAAMRADLDAGVDYLEALVRVVERNVARPGIVELFATLSAEATSPAHPAHAYFQRRYADVLAATTAVFEEHRAAGTLRQGVEPRSAARRLVAVMDGLQVQWLLGTDSAADSPADRVDMAAEVRAQYLSFLV